VGRALSTLAPAAADAPRHRRLKLGAWLIALAAVLAILEIGGAGIVDWLRDLLDTLGEVSAAAIVAALTLQTAQTALTALGWHAILQYAYPGGAVRYREVLAAYAIGVAMNGFLPANVGSVVTKFMFVALIHGATVPGVLAAAVVQKIFFTLAGLAVYAYLFLSVPGSASLELGALGDHPLATLVIVAGGAALVVIVVRFLWQRLRSLWEKAKAGGAILGDRRAYLVGVVLPSFGAWLAKLGVTAVFLAAYGIPVTFHTVMTVTGGNSLANTVSFTPGGVGITQAVNAASLGDVTDATTATAYSLGQQIIVTAWNVVLALALALWALGRTRTRDLVESSYVDARAKVAEERAARAARRALVHGADEAGVKRHASPGSDR
jgi:uncharacterized membrane protein YbhN (UPF0104 family)